MTTVERLGIVRCESNVEELLRELVTSRPRMIDDEVPVTRVEILTRPTVSGNLVPMLVETRSWRMP